MCISQRQDAANLAGRLASLEQQLLASRRLVVTALLVGLAFLILGQVKVKDASFEIHPNVSGANPNDSYLLKLIGDGDTGADRAMTLHTIPTTDTNYRLAISDNGGNERVSITDDGDVGIGTTSPAYPLDVNGDARIGWHGSSTRIKILPNDFVVNNDSTPSMLYNDNGGGSTNGVEVGSSSQELYAFFAIPTGYKATHVRIYGDNTNTVTVYETVISTGLWGSSLGSAAVGTEIDITDVNSTTTNFLVLQVALTATGNEVAGGYVTIARQ